MKHIAQSIIMFAVFLAVGCATSYQSSSLTGGYTDTQLAPDIFRVSFRGNGYTSPERAQDYAMLRAAELALQHEFNYIAIIEERSTISAHSITTQGHAETTGSAYSYGNYTTYSGHTTYTPGQTTTFYKPRSGLLFQGFKTKPEGIMTFDSVFLRDSLRQKYHVK